VYLISIAFRRRGDGVGQYSAVKISAMKGVESKHVLSVLRVLLRA
jgi:hypothetical protein